MSNKPKSATNKIEYLGLFNKNCYSFILARRSWAAGVVPVANMGASEKTKEQMVNGDYRDT